MKKPSSAFSSHKASALGTFPSGSPHKPHKPTRSSSATSPGHAAHKPLSPVGKTTFRPRGGPGFGIQGIAGARDPDGQMEGDGESGSEDSGNSSPTHELISLQDQNHYADQNQNQNHHHHHHHHHQLLHQQNLYNHRPQSPHDYPPQQFGMLMSHPGTNAGGLPGDHVDKEEKKKKKKDRLAPPSPGLAAAAAATSSPLSPLGRFNGVYPAPLVIQHRPGLLTVLVGVAMLALTLFTLIEAALNRHPLGPGRNLYVEEPRAPAEGKEVEGEGEGISRHVHQNMGCPSPIFVLKEAALISYALSPFVIPLQTGLWPDQLEEWGRIQQRMAERREDRGLMALLDSHVNQASFWGLNVTSVALGAFGLLVLSFLESSLLVSYGSRRRACQAFALCWLLLLVYRTLLGFIFSRALGWFAPAFFISDSLQECGRGINPLLLALLPVAFFQANHLVSRNFGKFTFYLPIWLVVVVLTFVDGLIGRTFWWNLSGLLAGLTTSFVFLCLPDPGSQQIVMPLTSYSLGRPLSCTNRILRALACTVILIFGAALFLGLPRLLPHSAAPTGHQLRALANGKDKLMTFLFFSAPRPNGRNHLLDTLQSYSKYMPRDPEDPLYHMFRLMPFTTFAQHPAYEETRMKMLDDADVIQSYLHWVQLDVQGLPGGRKQRQDFATGLIAAAVNVDTRYIAIIEDDFPLCKGGWGRLMSILYEANVRVPGHCGLFVGTGGSGLILKTSLVSTIADLLLNIDEDAKLDPTDVVIQDCLRGLHPKCRECAGTLVSSEELLMYHTGHDTSTGNRMYTKEAWQCGWRQPFNGEHDVVVL